MRKSNLLELMDDALLEKLYGFCYARTNDSYEARELCSDIVFALVKTTRSKAEIDNPYPYIWRVARNIYADFADSRRRHTALFCNGDPEEIFSFIAAKDTEDCGDELLRAVYRRISFLSKAYREVMILFYLDGLSAAEIARLQGTSETAVRQRLFSARKKIRNEVTGMIRRTVPEYLLPEWRFFNFLAGMPVLDSLVESLIEKNILTPPENGIGAEGCWMSVEK